ncbi:MAG: hypothetical protein WB441_02540 [Nocardioidaceae bacterium]
MTASDVHCDFCDLPLAHCVHGQPPPAPKAAPAPVATPRAKPRKRAAGPSRVPGAPVRPVTRRWTPPEVLKPLIIAVLTQAGGELDAEDLFLELEIAADDVLLPGDSERTPGGELRWQYAARRARLALVEEGLMSKGRPGVWQLSGARGHAR